MKKQFPKKCDCGYNFSIKEKDSSAKDQTYICPTQNHQNQHRVTVNYCWNCKLDPSDPIQQCTWYRGGVWLENPEIILNLKNRFGKDALSFSEHDIIEHEGIYYIIHKSKTSGDKRAGRCIDSRFCVPCKRCQGYHCENCGNCEFECVRYQEFERYKKEIESFEKDVREGRIDFEGEIE